MAPRRLCGRVVALGVLLGLLMAAPAGAAAGGLVGRWHLDEITNVDQQTQIGSTPDSSGNGEGLSAGSITVGPGRYGNAFSFSPGSVVQGPAGPALQPSAFTVLAWIRRAGSPGTNRYLVSKGADGCTAASWALHTDNATAGPRLYIWNGSQAAFSPTIDPSVAWDGNWHAIAASYDGTRLRAYLDGAEVGSGTPATLAVKYATSPTTDLSLGGYANQQNCFPADFRYSGDLDEVQVYDHALAASQIATLAATSGPAPPELPDAPPPPDGGGPSGGGASSGGSGGPVVTSVSAVRPVSAGGRATLLAQTTGAAVAHYDWDLNGDGRTDATCGASQPGISFRQSLTGGARIAAAASATARVTAVGALGLTSTNSVTYPVGTVAASSKIGALLKALPPVVACQDSGSAQAVSSKTLALCLPSSDVTVKSGILQMQGCLRPLTALSELPAAEYGIVREMSRWLPRHGFGRDTALATVLNFADAYVARGPVRVNGVDITPLKGARVVVFPQINAIASSDAEVEVGRLILRRSGSFIMDTATRNKGTVALGTFTPAAGSVASIGGFPMRGDVTVTLDAAGARVDTAVGLPSWADIGGLPALGSVSLRATMAAGLSLDARLGPIDLAVGGLGLSDLQLTYTEATREWRGQAKACAVPGLACLDMVPRADEPADGVVIRNGSLARAKGTLRFDPSIALFPGVQLTKIGFGIGLDPTRLLGSAGITAFAAIDVDGRLVVAFPSAAAPYVLDPDEVGTSFPSEFYGRRFTTATIAVGADAFFRIPIIDLRVKLGGAYVLYNAPGYVAVGGGVDADFLGIVSLTGKVYGEMNAANGRFSFVGQARACVVDIICAGATAAVSTVGAGGCVTIETFLGDINVGGGVHWDGDIYIWPFDGCRWTRFRDANVFSARVRASASAAGAPVTVKARTGDPDTAYRLDGTGGAPLVKVTTPSGETLTATPGAGVAVSRHIRILRSLRTSTTVVGLVGPRTGNYVIEPLDGSPAIARITRALDPPPAKASGTVSGGPGLRRSLSYDVLGRPGQAVTFLEQTPGGSREIGRITGGGRGRLSFTSSPGRGTRTIVARFELGGVPAERLTIARFTPPAATLGTPTGLRARRSGTTLRLSWAAVPGAARYEIVTEPAAASLRRTLTRATTLLVRRVPRTTRVVVGVRAIDPQRHGGTRIVRLPAAARARTAFKPFPARTSR